MQVQFIYKPGQIVKPRVGDTTGIVDSCAVNRQGTNSYFVKTPDGGQWWDEEDISVAAIDDRLGG